MTMATESERIARIEGAYEHLATKADVEAVKTAVHEVRTEVQTVKTGLQAEIQTVKSDLREEMQTLKSELQTDIQSVSSEIARRDSWNQERSPVDEMGPRHCLAWRPTAVPAIAV